MRDSLDSSTFVRTCRNPLNNPKCVEVITYKSKSDMRCGDENNTVCVSCRSYKRILSDKARENISKGRIGVRVSLEARKKMSERRLGKPRPRSVIDKMMATREATGYKDKLSKRMMGENNPFYGKKHTEETKRKLSAANSNQFFSQETRRKISIAHLGKKNPMYGKCAPLEAGCTGIGGWFKGVYFRSSCELRFLLENQDAEWKSAESEAFRIGYVNDLGCRRNYFPDFVSGKELVEVKPIGWQGSRIANKGKNVSRVDNIKRKCAAAKRFCRKNGFIFRFVEIKGISRKKVFEMRKNGYVKLNRKWEDKYLEYCNG